MQPIVSAGESSAVTITGKVRRRTLWRFVDSYGAADGTGPYSSVCSLVCFLVLVFVRAVLYGAASHSCTIVTATESVEAGEVGWHGSLCLSVAVLPLRQHVLRLRQRKGCELDLLGFRE